MKFQRTNDGFLTPDPSQFCEGWLGFNAPANKLRGVRKDAALGCLFLWATCADILLARMMPEGTRAVPVVLGFAFLCLGVRYAFRCMKGGRSW